MKKILSLCMLLSGFAHGTTTPSPVALLPSLVISSATSAANSAATVTVSTPPTIGPYSTGYTNYLTHVYIVEAATGTMTNANNSVNCTTTNLSGTVSYRFPSNLTAGQVTVLDTDYSSPLTGVQGDQVTVVCPATGAVNWNIQVSYTQAP